MGERDAVDLFDEARAAAQGVAPVMHRRGAGMAVLADEGDLVPADRLYAGDDADVLVLGFEIGALLDVDLEERRQRVLTAALGPAIADAVERGAEGDAGAVLA